MTRNGNKMPARVPQEVHSFLREPVFAHVATINKDGSPRVAMMWTECDGQHIIVNSDLGAVKVKNIRRDPRVFVSFQPTGEYPRRYVRVSGRVVSMTTEGANAHIDALTLKYLGVTRYPRRKRGMRRIKICIEPLEVMAPFGLDSLVLR